MVSLTLLADVDNNGKIDYQELMKHFEDLFFMVKYHMGLHEKTMEMDPRKGSLFVLDL